MTVCLYARIIETWASFDFFEELFLRGLAMESFQVVGVAKSVKDDRPWGRPGHLALGTTRSAGRFSNRTKNLVKALASSR